MGLFRKIQSSHRNDTTRSTYHEEGTSSTIVPKGRSSPKLGKWICGSSASKEALLEDNKITQKGSASTSSSHEDKRDDHDRTTSNKGRSSSHREKNKTDCCDNCWDNSLVASLPPPAAEAAFHGAPRFDWIDVEFHAATRVQKIFRRHLVLQEMEEAGLTTSYIRNRKRQRKANASFLPTSTENAPEFGLACCSMGMAFGNGCEDFDVVEDNRAYKDFQRKQYEEKTKYQKEREEFLSRSYLEQKGISNKVDELEQNRFRAGDEMLLGL